jgi:hypothetical protein
VTGVCPPGHDRSAPIFPGLRHALRPQPGTSRTPAIAYAFGGVQTLDHKIVCGLGPMPFAAKTCGTIAPPALMTCGRLHGSQTRHELDQMALNRCCVGV